MLHKDIHPEILDLAETMKVGMNARQVEAIDVAAKMIHYLIKRGVLLDGSAMLNHAEKEEATIVKVMPRAFSSDPGYEGQPASTAEAKKSRPLSPEEEEVMAPKKKRKSRTVKANPPKRPA